MTSALEVVVRENRPADDRQVGVRAEEVVREHGDEVEKTAHALLVHVHGPVLGAHGDAMLVEVGIGRVLESPALPFELDGHDPEILTRRVRASRRARRAPGVGLVLNAELAGGVDVAGRRCSRACDVARVLLRLREVDRDLEVSPAGRRRPLHVPRDGGSPHVPHVAGQRIEVVGRRNGTLFRGEKVKVPRDLRRPRREHAHHAHRRTVAAVRGVLEETVRDGDLGKPEIGRLEVDVGATRHRSGTGLPHGLEQGVIRPRRVERVDKTAADPIRDEVRGEPTGRARIGRHLFGAVALLGSYLNHDALAPSVLIA